MGRILERVQADPADPLGDKASVLACRQMVFGLPATWEQALANLPAAHPEMVIHRLPRHFGQLKPNRPTGLALPDVGAVNRVAVGCHVIHEKSDEIAAAQLAVDGEIEERQVAHASLQLQPRTD